MARATRSSSAGRSRRPFASTTEQWSVPAPVVTAMWKRCSPCLGRSVTSPAVAPRPTSRAPVGTSFAARSRARCASATAVSVLHAWPGWTPRNAASARESYGTSASSSNRDPPGTRSSSAIAPLPPPVIASTAWRPDACICAIVCRHDASDWRSAPLASKAAPMVEEILGGVNGVVCSKPSPDRQGRRAMRTRLLLMAALAVLPLIATAPALEPPTFSDEGVRILQARCQTCHRPGEHAPFALLTYPDAFDKKDDIRDAVKGRVMPPWKPVPGFGDFLESRRLSDRELTTLVRWIEAGAPQGDRATPPPPPPVPHRWELRPPPHLLQMPPAYTVAARGRRVPRCLADP